MHLTSITKNSIMSAGLRESLDLVILSMDATLAVMEVLGKTTSSDSTSSTSESDDSESEHDHEH